jgi:IS5 family transposase
MIQYTPQNQLSLELFKHPFEQALDKENRWVKLAAIVPWDALAEEYAKTLRSNSGRNSVDVRTVIAALIVKHKLRLDDRGTIAMIQENIYLQYFCGLAGFTTDPVFDPSLFVDIRRRLGSAAFDKLNQRIIEKAEAMKPHQARIIKKLNQKNDDDNPDNADSSAPNKGILKVDATIADQEITYPTDLKLLNEARENLERIIDELFDHEIHIVKPRDYRRVARANFLSVARKKRKSKREIRRGIKAQLQYVSRNIKIIAKLRSHDKLTKRLSNRDTQILQTIEKLYDQQKQMYDTNSHQCPDRIVNIYQPHVRPMVRGKDKANVEFGAKINISEVNGFVRLDTLSWDAYNETKDLKKQVERYKALYGRYPEYVLADQIYLSRENRAYLKERDIQITGKPLGRPKKNDPETPQEKYRKKKIAAKRNHVEAKFGQAKRGYNLNNIKARLPETSEAWINAIFMVMNLTKLLEIANFAAIYPFVLINALHLKINLIIPLVHGYHRCSQTEYKTA